MRLNLWFLPVLLLGVVSFLFQTAETSIFELLSFLPTWAIYVGFYIFGYAGIWYHILSQPSNEQTVMIYVQTHRLDVTKSILAYNILVVLWWTGALVTAMSLKSEPSALSLVLGYFSQSILGHGLAKIKERMTG